MNKNISPRGAYAIVPFHEWIAQVSILAIIADDRPPIYMPTWHKWYTEDLSPLQAHYANFDHAPSPYNTSEFLDRARAHSRINWRAFKRPFAGIY